MKTAEELEKAGIKVGKLEPGFSIPEQVLKDDDELLTNMFGEGGKEEIEQGISILLCNYCGEEFESYSDRSYCHQCSEDGVELYGAPENSLTLKK